jgi:hypothetical protein
MLHVFYTNRVKLADIKNQKRHLIGDRGVCGALCPNDALSMLTCSVVVLLFMDGTYLCFVLTS